MDGRTARGAGRRTRNAAKDGPAQRLVDPFADIDDDVIEDR